MAKVFISTTSFERANPILDEYIKKGNKVSFNPFGRKLTSSELAELAHDVDGIIAGTETLNRATLEKLPKLKVISRCGTGMDNVDLKAAQELGIKVFNTPDGPTQAVAELTMGLLLSLLRHIPESDSDIRFGKWNKYMGSLLCQKKIGIIGLGRIGKRMAELIMPFNCELSCYDPKPDLEFIARHKIKNTSFRDILVDSDIITIHVSLQAGEGCLVGAQEIALMKNGAYLINTSRAEAVDEAALAEALRNNKLSGAAMDVYGKEPYAGPLTGLKNTVLTPHIGSYAKEARIKMETEAVENLIKGLSEAQKIRR